MNNLLPYCGLVDVRIDASDKDLPVTTSDIRVDRGVQDSPQNLML